jgi:hypothetical protein
MESIMRLALLFSALVLIGAAVPNGQDTPSFREDIVLIDGRYLHVKILSSNDEGIQVQLLDTGGQVFIAWGLINEPDRDRIMIERGHKTVEKIFVEEGHRVTTKMGDTYEGRVVNDAADEITLKHRGSLMPIPKSSIKEIEKLSAVDVLLIYAPEEYYNKRAGELKVPDDDIPGNMELGDLALGLNLYEKSYAHYKKVRDTDPGYESGLIDNRLKLLEELSKNKQIRDALDEARRQTYYKQFAKALTQFETIIAIKDLPATLKAEAELLKQKTIKARYEHFRLEVRKDYEATLRNKIRALSRDDKLKLEEARRKLRAELHKEIVAEIAARHGLDPKIDVEKMWEERGFHQPRIATYGSGSFIVLGRAPDLDKYEAEMNKYLQDVLRKQQGSRNDQGGSLSAQPEKLPKPPTKEEWWTKVSTSQDREQWMLAFWAENSKKVTVLGDRWEDCGRCGATGSLKFSGSQGDVLRAPCPTCQGHKRHKGVSFK